ncbi:MAG: SRPBCC domain-containing protein [Gammaproteobacteria bacterium]|nr:SRPBCC domain-containing protein [Gammaproteobacteria bacterium]
MAEAVTDSMPDRVLQLVRHYPHPRERVFAAWAHPQQLVKWWGPKGVHIPHYRIDVRADGEWETTMRNEDGGEFFVSGKFVEISPPARLVFTWAWSNDGVRGHETTVTVEFEAKDGGTELRLTQAPFESNESRNLHNEGWTSSLQCLATHLLEDLNDG